MAELKLPYLGLDLQSAEISAPIGALEKAVNVRPSGYNGEFWQPIGLPKRLSFATNHPTVNVWTDGHRSIYSDASGNLYLIDGLTETNIGKIHPQDTFEVIGLSTELFVQTFSKTDEPKDLYKLSSSGLLKIKVPECPAVGVSILTKGKGSDYDPYTKGFELTKDRYIISCVAYKLAGGSHSAPQQMRIHYVPADQESYGYVTAGIIENISQNELYKDIITGISVLISRPCPDITSAFNEPLYEIGVFSQLSKLTGEAFTIGQQDINTFTVEPSVTTLVNYPSLQQSAITQHELSAYSISSFNNNLLMCGVNTRIQRPSWLGLGAQTGQSFTDSIRLSSVSAKLNSAGNYMIYEANFLLSELASVLSYNQDQLYFPDRDSGMAPPAPSISQSGSLVTVKYAVGKNVTFEARLCVTTQLNSDGKAHQSIYINLDNESGFDSDSISMQSHFAQNTGNSGLLDLALVVSLEHNDKTFTAVSHTQLVSTDGNLNLPTLISYPDSRAKQFDIYMKSRSGAWNLLSSRKTQKHKLYNIAYSATEQVVSIAIDRAKVTHQSLPAELREIAEPDRLQASSLYGLLFPYSRSYSFSGRKIVGVASNAVQVSEGQFGQYPLLVFTDRDVWALQQGTGQVLFAGQSPINNQFFASTKAQICAGGRVVYAYSQGFIWAIIGSDFQKISKPIQPLLESFPQDDICLGFEPKTKELYVLVKGQPEAIVLHTESGKWYQRELYGDFSSIVSQSPELILKSGPYYLSPRGQDPQPTRYLIRSRWFYPLGEASFSKLVRLSASTTTPNRQDHHFIINSRVQGQGHANLTLSLAEFGLYDDVRYPYGSAHSYQIAQSGELLPDGQTAIHGVTLELKQRFGSRRRTSKGDAR